MAKGSPHRSPSLRALAYAQLESSPGRQLSTINKLVVALILVSVLLGIAGTESLVQASLGLLLPMTELALGLFFLIELALRTWAAGVRSEYAGPKGALRYLAQPLSIVDILVVVSLLAPFFGPELAILRLLRIVRLIALVKFGRYSVALRRLFSAFARRRYELLMSLVIASLVFLIAATGMYAIEGGIQPEAFGSIPRALWWALTTLTTVGYGDVYPVTPLGRVFAGLMAVAGIGLIAMPTGILAAAFTEMGDRGETAAVATARDSATEKIEK
ncbi:MAG: ion transporter [Gammaproteobacteria bacterium]|nr:ion transporter [Gammaproteobacteria bacterium]